MHTGKSSTTDCNHGKTDLSKKKKIKPERRIFVKLYFCKKNVVELALMAEINCVAVGTTTTY
jgi:hypothetical protein